MNKILLYNPKSAFYKHRIPNSILNIAASVEGKYDWVIVDGNCETDPLSKIESYLKTGEFGYLGFTVMPGPQLRQAIPLSKIIKERYPYTTMIWGGYFPSSQPKAVLNSGFVDFIINGPGDKAFPRLIDALENHEPYEFIKNLIYKADGKITKTIKEDLLDQDSLPPLPYDKLGTFYPIEKYLGKTYLGQRTMAYHSSIGCPFTCSFCAVVPIYEARWKAKSAKQVYKDVKYIKDKWGADAIEFHDNNFFVSEKRTVEFAKLIEPENMSWWGMARIDTMDKFSDASLEQIRRGGCKIIFFGAESGSNEVLEQLDKGGTQTGDQIIRFAERLKKFDIIPEYSFVLGTPAPTPEKVQAQIDFEIDFIKKVKTVNPRTEIVLYTYTPVPTEGSELYKQVLDQGFQYPQSLEDWMSPAWESFDLRKNPLTPWLKPQMVDKIRNFETVLNGVYPTVTDIRLNDLKRKSIKFISNLRYKANLYKYPYEIKLLQRFWKYRQPEISGF
ncbi:B12-binding domain-containing radical SAM protein [Mucilaginibacter ginsenosidivorax]|uniref:B12-binding domain-containing radical SAM protein n=1 Tax=Mucilaginibacter ginsenosidivorax TaxID=862126 RepID=A0A5B8W8F5_9SPHI|nr:radical SAM protein [Mucilaginibacter ginsenosidivorax]QEC80053.1 B12-binding domain-containing radical SAM protein [Mucilaginibacter ginsenosidivorax]